MTPGPATRFFAVPVAHVDVKLALEVLPPPAVIAVAEIKIGRPPAQVEIAERHPSQVGHVTDQAPGHADRGKKRDPAHEPPIKFSKT